jgi:hypothetical protein
MSLPGFSAEYGLYRSSRTYQRGGLDGGDHWNEMVVPALCNQTAYDQCIAKGSPEVFCLTQYGCILNGDICVGTGASAHCVFGGVLYCGGLPCPVGHPCCEGTCCSLGDSCCGESCCSPGDSCCLEKSCCSPTEQCCPSGTCCPKTGLCCSTGCCTSGQHCCSNACADLQTDPANCGSCGHVCQTDANCVNGSCVCPVVPAPTVCGPSFCAPGVCSPGGLTSSSNYFLVNPGCQDITGLTVSITALTNIVSSSGFTVQLNANSATSAGVDAYQQYVFLITGNSIQGQINNWQNLNTVIVCGLVNVGSTPISNGLPQGYTLRITLQYAGNSVSGALFQVLNGSQVVSSAPLSVSQTGCNCSLPSGYTCTGYQSSADLSAIAAFQVNIVGPDGGSNAVFTPGRGTITYAVSSGALTAVSNVPSPCVDPNSFGICTAETSNASYGPLTACWQQSMTQTFST